MEYWWAQPSSHEGSVHVHSRAKSVSGTQVMAAGWDFVDIQNQLDGIVRNKAIYLKVTTALDRFSILNEIYPSFFAVSYDSHMNRSRSHGKNLMILRTRLIKWIGSGYKSNP